MNSWNRLLELLDKTLGFPNKIRSTVKKRWQSFDQRTGEHVFVLEYRSKVKPGVEPPEKPPQYLRDIRAKKPMVVASATLNASDRNILRELMDMGPVRAVDSSASTGSPIPVKQTTRKARPRSKTRHLDSRFGFKGGRW
jgi:hypothetical protein